MCQPGPEEAYVLLQCHHLASVSCGLSRVLRRVSSYLIVRVPTEFFTSYRSCMPRSSYLCELVCLLVYFFPFKDFRASETKSVKRRLVLSFNRWPPHIIKLDDSNVLTQWQYKTLPWVKPESELRSSMELRKISLLVTTSNSEIAYHCSMVYRLVQGI